MQGKQRLQQALFVAIDLETFIPKEHRLRRIDRVLDFSCVPRLTKHCYSRHRGRTSIDPVVFFKMQILKYFYGIKSDRQLCEDIHVNLAFRWFLRLSVEDPVPDHSSMSRIRDRIGEDVVREIFELLVQRCRSVGLVSGYQMLTDATLIEANAAKESLAPQKKERSKAGNRSLPKGSSPGDLKKKRVSMKTHTSKTDPDASFVSRSGVKPRLYYKAHCTIDGGRSRIITDCHVTTGAQHECTVFQARVDHHVHHLGLQPAEWLADRGYGHGPAYDHLRRLGIRAYIPLRDNGLGRGKLAPTKGFRYDRKRDVYTCPYGYTAVPHAPSENITRYVVKGGVCGRCPFRQQCLKNSNGRKSRWIARSKHQDAYDAIHRRRTTEAFRRRLRDRSWKMEGIFAETKDNHGLRRAQYRGRSKVQIQVYLVAITYNLKRLASAARGSSSHVSGRRRLTMVLVVVEYPNDRLSVGPLGASYDQPCRVAA